MILSFIKLGIKTLLKTYCERINIKNINLFINNKFNGKIDKLIIEAENIIYKKIDLHYLRLCILNLEINLNPFKDLKVKNCMANISIKLTSQNLNSIFFNNRWSNIRNKINKFISNEETTKIEIKDGFIYFISSNKSKTDKTYYQLVINNNDILILNNFSKQSIKLPMDNNIKFNEILIKNNIIELKFISKIIFNN